MRLQLRNRKNTVIESNNNHYLKRACRKKENMEFSECGYV